MLETSQSTFNFNYYAMCILKSLTDYYNKIEFERKQI